MSIEIIIPAIEKLIIKKIIIKINQNIKDALITIIDDTPDQDMSKILKILVMWIISIEEKKLGRGSAVLVGMRESLKIKVAKFS